MTRIPLEELQTRVASGNISEDELREYFEFDPDASGPFAPRFRINNRTVLVPDDEDIASRSAQLLNAANWLSRADRRHRFAERIRSGYDGPRIVSEGDSWFQYPLLLKDTIDHVSDHHAVFSLGAAGDLLERMARKQEYLNALEETGATILMFSGGGNDLVAGGALASHLESYHRDLSPADYLLPSFDALLSQAFGHYERILRQIRGSFPHVHVLFHGYDYIIPDNGRWLGKPMQERGIRSRELQAAISRVMVDRLNRGLRRLSRSIPKATYIDCRGTVRADQWHDELHPRNEGYGAVAALFLREIRRIDNESSSVPTRSFISGPFGEAKQLHRTVNESADSLTSKSIHSATEHQSTRGISLHIGLNTVDPAHYAGWDGQLASCEQDAHDMAAIAVSKGFEPTLLLTRQATRDAVVSAIMDAAQQLHEGDMFMLSVSGHGGIMPDFNEDEDDDADMVFDETLCLYDFQIIDDELYQLWTRFRPGVRVLMVADTCHSGNMVRMGVPMPFGSLSRTQLPAYAEQENARRMPFAVAERVWQMNLNDYKSYALQFDRVDERIVNNPLTAPISASVLLLGACHEHQLAGDGPDNGQFTAALKLVWNNGAFTGNYKSFIDQINLAMDRPNQIAQLDTSLVRDQGFIAQVPFSMWDKPRTGTTPGHATDSARIATWLSASAETQTESYSQSDEGHEPILLPADEVERAFQQIESGPGTRGAPLAAHRAGGRSRQQWTGYSSFVSFIESLDLEYFHADEFLLLGSHTSKDGNTTIENEYPPHVLWPNIANTARVLDSYRKRVARPILITSAYRSDRYNHAIGGASGSQHKRFCALDFVVRDMDARDVATEIRQIRDIEKAFAGGIGRYNSFTHLDTRGTNNTWPVEFRDEMKVRPSYADGHRRNVVRDLKLAKADLTRSRSRGTDASPITEEIGAAINSSALISFTEKMTLANKSDVLASTLFAQLAADAAAEPTTERQLWFDTYINTLSVLGWMRSSSPMVITQAVSGSATIDSAILDTIAAVATGNQMLMLKEAIRSLKSLASNDNRITLFDRNTKYRNGSNFQVGAADGSAGMLTLALGAYNFIHDDQKKNVLFLHWGEETLDLWISSQTMTLELSRFDEVRDIVNSRIREVQIQELSAIPLDTRSMT